MNIRSFPIAAVVALILGISDPVTAAISKESKPAEAVQIEFLGNAFGLFDTTGGQMKFSPGGVVPLVEGQAYGWVLRIRTAPATWGESEPIGTRKLSDDARVSITERSVEPINGVLFNSWAVAKGDPPGKYEIRVFVENRLVATFDFEVR